METNVSNSSSVNIDDIVKLLNAGADIRNALSITKEGKLYDSIKAFNELPDILQSTEGLTASEIETLKNQLIITRIALVQRTNKDGKVTNYFHCLVCPRLGGNTIEANYTVFENQSKFYELMKFWGGLNETEAQRFEYLSKKQNDIITVSLQDLKDEQERKNKIANLPATKNNPEKANAIQAEINELSYKIDNYAALSLPLSENETEELQNLQSKTRQPLRVTYRDFEEDKATGRANWQNIRYPFQPCKSVFINGQILYKELFEIDGEIKGITLVQLQGETKTNAIERYKEFRKGTGNAIKLKGE